MVLVAGVRWSFRGKDVSVRSDRATGATEDARSSGRAARPGGPRHYFARPSWLWSRVPPRS